MNRYNFLIETYRTERIKTLSVWSQFEDDDMEFRPEPRARTPHEHMVHQCISQHNWMKNMLGIDTKLTPENWPRIIYDCGQLEDGRAAPFVGMVNS